MLRITLYKNCILNETYQNVFSTGLDGTKSTLEKYLDTLTSKSYNIDYVYQENSGTLVFDYEIAINQNIYEYNYMKVETIEDDVVKIKRYCFIQNISIKNELVYLDYAEDIWSSYSDKIKGITESYLERSRVLSYKDFSINLYNLPIEYAGNNDLQAEKIVDFDDIPYYICFKIQWYDTANFADATKRFAKVVFLKDINEVPFDFRRAKNTIETLLYLAQNQNLLDETDHTNYYFTISDVMLIPTILFGEYVPFGTYFRYTNLEIFKPNAQGMPSFYKCYEIYNFETLMHDDNGIIISSFELENDFKIKQIGTISQKFDIINNGTDRTIKFRLLVGDYNINILLCFDNQFIDITDSFMINVPFSYLQGNEIAQQKLQRQIKTINGVYKITSGLAEIGLDIGQAIASGGISLAGTPSKTITKTLSKKLKSGSRKTIKTSTRENGTSSALDLISDNLGNVGQVISGITNLMEIYTPVYSTSYGTFIDCDGEYTALTGIYAFKINSDNDEFVERYINNTGFIVYEFINVFSLLNLDLPAYMKVRGINYNTIAFSTVNVYGSFTRNIALILNEILENGIKIWFNENMQEDDYLEDIL